jgi:hypothetical protein
MVGIILARGVIMNSMSDYKITGEFELNGCWYIAFISPYYILSEEEISLYKISEYSFVAHVFSEEGFKTFEIFPDHHLHWNTNASALLVDREIVEVLGQMIVNQCT